MPQFQGDNLGHILRRKTSGIRSQGPGTPELESVTAVHHVQSSLEEKLGLEGSEVRIRINKYKLWRDHLQAGEGKPRLSELP